MPFLHLDGQTRPLPPGETVVGSGAMAGWRVASQNLAARHFVVRVEDGGRVLLSPFSAQHVVVVAGRQVSVEGQDLADGDTIAAGSAHFVYTRETGSAHAPRLEPPRSAILLEERARRIHPIEGRALTIGRDRASAIVLRDPSVSRFHAELRPEAGRHVLYSSGATGTRVNGQRLAGPYVLEEGDVVEIGESTLRYTLAPPPDGWTMSRGVDDDDAETGRRATLGATVVDEPLPGERPGGVKAAVIVLVAAAVIALVVALAR
jgi:predicted component of type VI protein secretion system